MSNLLLNDFADHMSFTIATWNSLHNRILCIWQAISLMGQLSSGYASIYVFRLLMMFEV